MHGMFFCQGLGGLAWGRRFRGWRWRRPRGFYLGQLLLPPGKLTVRYWKWPCLMGKSTISTGHFQLLFWYNQRVDTLQVWSFALNGNMHKPAKEYTFFPTSLCGVLGFDSVSRSSASSSASSLSHTTTLSQTLFHTQLAHTQTHTTLSHKTCSHNFVTHHLSTQTSQIAHTYTAQGRCAHVNRMISHKRFLPGGTCMCVFKQATAPSGSK